MFKLFFQVPEGLPGGLLMVSESPRLNRKNSIRSLSRNLFILQNFYIFKLMLWSRSLIGLYFWHTSLDLKSNFGNFMVFISWWTSTHFIFRVDRIQFSRFLGCLFTFFRIFIWHFYKQRKSFRTFKVHFIYNLVLIHLS